jgi:transcriptional regulator with XRE-family HTH domain
MYRKSDFNEKSKAYIREKIKQARLAANESQSDLAKFFGKSRVTISDMERGRVDISASDLSFIAAHYNKPISYFFPPRVTANKEDLTQLDEELLFLFFQLPDTQKYIAIEYIRLQVEITNNALKNRGKQKK